MNAAELDLSAHHALTKFHNRTIWEPVHYDAPFEEVLATMDDGLEGEAGEWEWTQRDKAIRKFFEYITSGGLHPASILKMLVAAGRAMHIEPFNQLTMEESGEVMAETKASHSHRCKIISKEIRRSGAKGDKLPGQKGREASESYRTSSAGNCNRLGGEKFRRRKQRLAARLPQAQEAAFPKSA